MTMADHLNDDALSAILDGDEVPGADHTATCASCRGRLDALSAAAAAVGAPPAPPDPGRREAAVAAALAAAGATDDGTATAGAGAEEEPAGAVATLPRRRSAPRWLLAAAAAIAVAALAVPLATSDDGDDRVATSSGDHDTFAGGAGGGAATSEGTPGVADGGDLGAIGAGTDLRPVVHQALDGRERGAGLTADGTGLDASSSAGTEESTAADRAPSSAAAAPVACLDAARDRHGAVGSLVFRATATFDGRPAVVLAFLHDDRLVARVLAVEGCDLLTFQAFDA